MRDITTRYVRIEGPAIMHGWDRIPRLAEQIPAIESRRVLLGFMSGDAALRKLQSSRTVGSPVDPLGSPKYGSHVEPPDEADYADVWERANASIDRPPTFESSAIELRDLPDEDGVAEHIEAFVNDPLTQKSLGDRPADSWAIQLVPIEHLVAFQPAVTKTAYRDEVVASSDGLLDILQYALQSTLYHSSRTNASGITTSSAGSS